MSFRVVSSASSNLSPAGRARRHARRAQFSIMVCGQQGTGKTTFINSLVGKRLFPSSNTTASYPLVKPVDFLSAVTDISLDDGTRLSLTVVDTLNFGLRQDATDDTSAVSKYIQSKYDEVLSEESRIRRNPRFHDSRVHACIYFVHPSPRGLSDLDIETLNHVGPLANVILVLGRADQLTLDERAQVRAAVLRDVQVHGLQLFSFAGDDTDSEFLRSSIPFAMTSSTEYDQEDRPTYRCKLAFGVVDAVDPKQSDFVLLRDALLDGFRTDLEESTRDVLYEAYRTRKLTDPANKLHANRTSVLQPEVLVGHGNRLKEEQLRRENALLRAEEDRVTKEIEEKRRQLLSRERELRELELKLARERGAGDPSSASASPKISHAVPVASHGNGVLPAPPALASGFASGSTHSLNGSPSTPTIGGAGPFDNVETTPDTSASSQGSGSGPTHRLPIPSGFISGSVMPRSGTPSQSGGGASNFSMAPAARPDSSTTYNTARSSDDEGGRPSSPDLPPRSPNRPPSVVGGSLPPLLVKKNSIQFRDFTASSPEPPALAPPKVPSRAPTPS